MDRSMKSPSKNRPQPKPPKKPMAVPFNPDSISTEKPENRAKYERKFGLPPQGGPSKKRPAMKK